MREGSTKQRILAEAKSLFAAHGYGSTGMDRLAEAVGIRAPSLYKHYAGKEAILLAILEDIRENERAIDLFEDVSDVSDIADENAFRDAVVERVRALLDDEELRESRRFLQTLSLSDARVAACRLARHDAAMKALESTLERMILERILKDEDVHVMALQLLSPILLAIELCDTMPTRKREVLATCSAHAASFFRLYRRPTDSARDRHTPLGRPMPGFLM